MVFEYSVLYCLYLFRKIFIVIVYGSDIRGRFDDGQAVFVDFIAVLFCGIREVSGRRGVARNKCNASVYGGDIYRPCAACGAGICIIRTASFRNRHLVRMANWLDDCDGTFAVFPFEMSGCACTGKVCCIIDLFFSFSRRIIFYGVIIFYSF